MKKRIILSLFLSLALIMTSLPYMAFAEGEPIASGTSGTCNWSIDENGVLTLGGGELDAWDFYYSPWYDYRESITAVKATAPVKLLTGEWMFVGCENMTSADLSNFDTSSVTDMTGMFNGCKSLTSLDLRPFDTGNLMYMGQMFQGCESLTSIDLSYFDTSNVEYMGYLFGYCISLKSLDVSSFDTNKALNMYEMFDLCWSLEELKVGSEFKNEGSSENSPAAFPSNMKSSVTGTVYKGGQPIPSKVAATYVTTTDPVTNFIVSLSLDGVDNTQNNEKVKIKSHVKLDEGETLPANSHYVWSIADTDAAGGATVEPSDDGLNAKVWADYAISCFATVRLQIVSGETVLGQAEKTVYFGGDPIASGTSGTCDWTIDRNGVLKLGGGELADWGGSYPPWNDYKESIKAVTASAPVKILSGAHMFSECANATSIDTKYFDTSQAERFDWMFVRCESITSLDVSNFDTSNAVNMEMMFCQCINLTSLDVSNFETGKVTTMEAMFGWLQKIPYLDVSNFDTGKVENMEMMFHQCFELKNLDVSRFDTSSASNLYAMFAGCNSLTELDASNFDTNNVTEMDDMFGGCNSLQVLKIGNEFKNEPTQYGIVTFPIDMWDSASGTLYNSGDTIPSRVAATYVSTYEPGGPEDPQDPTDEHTYGEWKVVKKATCTEAGKKERTCSHCGKTETQTIPAKGHTWNASYTIDKKATLTANGSKSIHCSACGAKKFITSIAYPKTFKFSVAKYVYDGGVKTPAVTVTDANGSKLVSGTDYTVTYSSGRKNVGQYSVTVNMKGAYSGSKTLYFNIIPKPTTLKSVTGGPEAITVKWNKMATQTTGYQIQYSTSSTFEEGNKTKAVRITSNTTVSYKLTGLKAKQKYYVRIRTYKHLDNYNLYSAWSSAQSVKTKDISLSDSSIYMKQKPYSSNCTLYACAHMMRRKAILDGRTDWTKISQTAIEDPNSAFCKAAWIQGKGLKGEISYKLAKGYVIKAKAYSCGSGLTEKKLISLLNKHPEGVEIYDWTKNNHAVLVTGYNESKGIFYCVDSAKKAKIIKLSNSLLGDWHGNNQKKILKAIRQYWIVTN